MDKLKYIRIQQENNPYNGDIPIGADAENIDLIDGHNLQELIGNYDYATDGSIKEKFDSINIDVTSIVQKETEARKKQDTDLSNQISALRGAVGSPLVAATAAAMTDTSKIYVYTGNQSGYTNGNWYYYSGVAWVSGGIYNETALETDKTLAVEDKAADAKITGNAITELKDDLSKVINEKTTVLSEAQIYYIEFQLVAGKTYNITNKGTSGQFTMNTRATKTGANLETIGTFRTGETKQFIPTEDAEWLVGYANSATTIYITEDGVLFSRVGELEDNVETNTEHIDYALSEIWDYSNKGLERLHGFWRFGNIAGGVIYSNVKYRAMSPLQVYDRDIVLTPVDSSNFSYSYSTANPDGSVIRTRAWITDASVNVPANQHFYVVVKRNIEDQSETINPNDFAGKVLITTKIEDNVETNTKHIDYTLSETQDYSNNGLERLHGFWGFGNVVGGKIDSNVKYRALSPLQVFDRDIVLTPVDPTNFSYTYSTANPDGSVIRTSGWKTDAATNVSAGQHFYVVVKRNTEDTSETINPNNFAGKVVINTKLYDIIISSIGESEIVSLNKPQEQMIYNLQKGRSTRFNDPFSPLTFIHFSDIHRAETLWKRICEYMDKYHSVIPFALHTGDYVKAYIEQYTDLYATQTPKNGYILNCVGNHDTYANSTGTEKATAETVYNLLFNHISGWNATFGTGSNIMYYYKDFADSGIRLVVLDQYYWDSTEESWLQSLFDDARTNNLAVITASHTNTAPLLTENRVDCTFTSYDATWDNGEQTITFIANLDTMIKTFKDAGGEHICHLSGHWHHDIIGHTANDTLCICIECATSNHANWCDSERIAGTKGYDCFNVISADRSLHQIRLTRIGNSVDFYGREKNILCYDYLNKTVITNS